MAKTDEEKEKEKLIFRIKNNDLSSTIYAGEFEKEEDDDRLSPLGNAISKGLSNIFFKAFSGLKEKLMPQWMKDFFISVEMFKADPRKFLDGWVADSPIGAAAGVLAAGLSGGLLLVVGGNAVGMVGKVGIGAIAKITGLGRVLGGAISGITGIAKWGWRIAGGLITGWTLGNLIRFGVSSASYLFNFNWNITDKQIEAQQKSLLTNLYRSAGAAIGATVGTLLCGTLPAELIHKNAKKLKINPKAIAEIKYIALNDGGFEYGEIYEEMVETLKSLITVTTQSVTQAIFLETYKNFRRVVKWFAKTTLIDKIPGLGDAIKKWGEEGSQSWSFATALEDAIDSIEDTNFREFTEEFFEEFMEVCSENLLIIAGAT